MSNLTCLFPSLMFMDHLVDITNRAEGFTQTGDPNWETPVTDVICTIQGKGRRVFTKEREAFQYDDEVTIMGDVQIGLGDILSNGRDKFGNVLFTSMKVENIRPLAHPRHGIVVRKLDLINSDI